jgi:putative hemolysin
MLVRERILETTRSPRMLSAHWAETEADRCEAQRLRWEVFVEELGARVDPEADGLERDRLDEFCDHLLIRETRSGRVVGTYRALGGDRATPAGGFYSESEFDLSRLHTLRERTVEMGRACVHPDFRNGAVISLLWSALLRYIGERGFHYVIGCGSIGTADGGHAAATVCRRLLTRHLAPESWRVCPRSAFALEGWNEVEEAATPPLIKGYLRLGAVVCGPPAWDPAFRCADLLLMLSMERLNGRYADRLLRNA